MGGRARGLREREGGRQGGVDSGRDAVRERERGSGGWGDE